MLDPGRRRCGGRDLGQAVGCVAEHGLGLAALGASDVDLGGRCLDLLLGRVELGEGADRGGASRVDCLGGGCAGAFAVQVVEALGVAARVVGGGAGGIGRLFGAGRGWPRRGPGRRLGRTRARA